MDGQPAGRFFPIQDMEFENLEPDFPFIELLEAQLEDATEEAGIVHQINQINNGNTELPTEE